MPGSTSFASIADIKIIERAILFNDWSVFKPSAFKKKLFYTTLTVKTFLCINYWIKEDYKANQLSAVSFLTDLRP